MTTTARPGARLEQIGFALVLLAMGATCAGWYMVALLVGVVGLGVFVAGRL